MEGEVIPAGSERLLGRAADTSSVFGGGDFDAIGSDLSFRRAIAPIGIETRARPGDAASGGDRAAPGGMTGGVARVGARADVPAPIRQSMARPAA